MTHNSSNSVFGSLPEHHVLKAVYWGLDFFTETYTGKLLLFYLRSFFYSSEKSLFLYFKSF